MHKILGKDSKRKLSVDQRALFLPKRAANNRLPKVRKRPAVLLVGWTQRRGVMHAKRIAGLLLGVSLLAASSNDYSAWWLTVVFRPQGSIVQGIPIQQIDSTWSAASLLRDVTLPADASKPGESVAEYGGAFETQADLDGDGRRERAVVGVYATAAGKRGRFLLILGADKSGRWSKRALFVKPGEAGFSVLFLKNKRLLWAFCMACDSSCEVVPSRLEWQLKCESCCEGV